MRTHAAVLVLALAAPAQELTRATLDALRARILPARDELAFRDVGWRTTLAAAVLEADAHDRPVLLWAMNGHPLGCT